MVEKQSGWKMTGWTTDDDKEQTDGEMDGSNAKHRKVFFEARTGS